MTCGVTMFRFRWFPRLVPLLALVVVLFATVGSASAATGTIQVGSATLVARGAAVDVPVTVSLTCDEGFTSGLVQLVLSQAQGRTLAPGDGAAQVPCGETQTVTVRVFAVSAPFHGGSAIANATLLQCLVDPDFGLVCSFTGIGTSQVIRITGR
jgi:hypothetical protein